LNLCHAITSLIVPIAASGAARDLDWLDGRSPFITQVRQFMRVLLPVLPIKRRDDEILRLRL
jgi:hypothetical protein